MPNLDVLAQVAIAVAVVSAALVLLAYYFVFIRDVVRQVFAGVQAVLDELGAVLERLASTAGQALPPLRRQLTQEGRVSLPFLVVLVAALAPILCLLVVVEVRLWGGYFESLFPEQIEIPLVGTISGGLLTALMPVAAGFLLGWLVEAALGVFPLPLLGALSSSPAASARLRAVFCLGLLVFWAFLAVTVFDAGNEVYDGLGESTCALRFAGEGGTLGTQSDLDITGSASSSAALSPAPADTSAAQAACVAEWKANDRARSIRLLLGELTLHLSAVFAWVILAAVGLVTLLVLALPVLGLGLSAGLTRLLSRAVGILLLVVESLLRLLRVAGVMIVRLLRWLGLPVPLPDPAPEAGPAAPLARPEPAMIRDAVGANGAISSQPVDERALTPGQAALAVTTNGTYRTP